MAIETHTIQATGETTLDEVLDAADDGSVQVERNGVVYQIQRTGSNASDEWDEELAERRRKILRETAGMWKDLDTNQIFADFYRRRGEDPPPQDLK